MNISADVSLNNFYLNLREPGEAFFRPTNPGSRGFLLSIYSLFYFWVNVSHEAVKTPFENENRKASPRKTGCGRLDGFFTSAEKTRNYKPTYFDINNLLTEVPFQ